MWPWNGASPKWQPPWKLWSLNDTLLHLNTNTSAKLITSGYRYLDTHAHIPGSSCASARLRGRGPARWGEESGKNTDWQIRGQLKKLSAACVSVCVCVLVPLPRRVLAQKTRFLFSQHALLMHTYTHKLEFIVPCYLYLGQIYCTLSMLHRCSCLFAITVHKCSNSYLVKQS